MVLGGAGLSFRERASLSSSAIHARADAWNALISGEGGLIPPEREQLQQRFPALLGTLWPRDVGSRLLVGWSGLMTQHLQQRVVFQPFTLNTFFEPHLDGENVDILWRIARELGVEKGVLDDREMVCRGSDLKALADRLGRIFYHLNHENVFRGCARLILSMLDKDQLRAPAFAVAPQRGAYVIGPIRIRPGMLGRGSSGPLRRCAKSSMCSETRRPLIRNLRDARFPCFPPKQGAR